MNKVLNIIIIVLISMIIGILITFGILKYLDYREQERIKNAIIKIDFVDNLDIPFNTEIKVSDLITSINGEYITDPVIDTSVVGKKLVEFKYLNEEEIKVPYKFYVNIVDNVTPIINVGETYSVDKGYSKNLLDVIMCADDYDDNPKCSITGEYDVNIVGSYPLVFEAEDFSGNKTIKNFTLKVTNPTKKSSTKTTTIPFKNLYNEYKNDHTKIGIDVSKWQGNINFEKVKDEGVEFVFIKLGGQNGINGDYYVDSKFEQNIKGFKEVGIPVGLYFYSYANSVEKGKKDALWVIEQIKDYEIDLPIAFDWENWSSFNKFKISFNTLTKTADSFINTIKSKGYDSMLYSSKYYLENMWLKNNHSTWLAHYIDKTTYEGYYVCWQRTSSAKIAGITDNTVDFNICYND